MNFKMVAKTLCLFILSLSFIFVGDSTWIVGEGQTGGDSYIVRDLDNVTPVSPSSANPVAVVDGNTYFLTIEKALLYSKQKSGNQVIQVIPGANATITEDCEVSSGDTLVIPNVLGATSLRALNSTSTDANTYFNPINSSTDTTKTVYFADKDQTSVNTYRKNKVTIEEGKVLTVKGTLNIAGVVGNATQSTSAHTSGNFAEITLKKDSVINVENGAKVNCFGYIKDYAMDSAGSINLKSGATMTQPFVVYDFAGGQNTCGRFLGNYSISTTTLLSSPTISLAKGQARICPFEIFDLPNIQCSYNIYSGSSIIGATDLYASDEHHPIGINIFGNSSSYLLQMTGGYLTAKYTPNTFGFTSAMGDNDNTRTLLKFHEGSNPVLNSMQMNIVVKKDVPVLGSITITAVVNTEVVKFPISYRYDIELESGSNARIKNDLKIMPGCDFLVNKGASVTFDGDTVVYKNFTDTKTTGKYPSKYKDGNFELNGLANFNAAFGGFINTTDTDNVAQINCGENFVNNCTDEEGNGTGELNGISSYDFTFTATSTTSSLRKNAESYLYNASNEQLRSIISLENGENVYKYDLNHYDGKNSIYGINYKYVKHNNEIVDATTIGSNPILFEYNSQNTYNFSKSNLTYVEPGEFEIKEIYTDTDCTNILPTANSGLELYSFMKNQGINNHSLNVYIKWVEVTGGKLTINYYTRKNSVANLALSETDFEINNSLTRVITDPNSVNEYANTSAANHIYVSSNSYGSSRATSTFKKWSSSYLNDLTPEISWGGEEDLTINLYAIYNSPTYEYTVSFTLVNNANGITAVAYSSGGALTSGSYVNAGTTIKVTLYASGGGSFLGKGHTTTLYKNGSSTGNSVTGNRGSFLSGGDPKTATFNVTINEPTTLTAS